MVLASLLFLILLQWLCLRLIERHLIVKFQSSTDLHFYGMNMPIHRPFLFELTSRGC
jgi:hypothetical protein